VSAAVYKSVGSENRTNGDMGLWTCYRDIWNDFNPCVHW